MGVPSAASHAAWIRRHSLSGSHRTLSDLRKLLTSALELEPFPARREGLQTLKKQAAGEYSSVCGRVRVERTEKGWELSPLTGWEFTPEQPPPARTLRAARWKLVEPRYTLRAAE